MILFVTGFAKIRLIAGDHNCSYSPLLWGKSLFVDFLFSSKIKTYDCPVIYLHSYNSGRAI